MGRIELVSGWGVGCEGGEEERKGEGGRTVVGL